MSKEYLDYDGLLYFWQKLKTIFLTDVSYNSSTKKIQKTKSGITSDVVTLATVATSGSYDDLSNKPTIPTAQNEFGKIKVGNVTIEADAVQDTFELEAGSNITLTPDTTNDKVTIEATDTVTTATTTGSGNAVTAVTATNGALTVTKGSTFLTSHQTIKQDGVTGATANRFGICTTASNTAAKTVSITTGTFSLEAGARISVKFNNINNADNPTLNVNSTGAKAIYNHGSALVDNALLYGVCDFIYDGNYWCLIGNNHWYAQYIDYDQTETVSEALDRLDLYKLSTSKVGVANGVCPLNASSKIDSSYLPSYVDDVIEAYPRSGQTELSSTWLSTTSGGSALTPETGKIYILMEDSTSYASNTQFRWSGTTYVKLADGGVSSITNAEIDTIMAT